MRPLRPALLAPPGDVAIPRHRVSVDGEIEHGPADGPGDRTRAFHDETLLWTGPINVALAAPADAADGVELDLIGSLQRDGVLTVTCTVRLSVGPDDWAAPEDDWAEEPAGAQAFSTVVPPDGRAPFSVWITGADDERIEVRGTIENRRGARARRRSR